jgi:hypothetical protein
VHVHHREEGQLTECVSQAPPQRSLASWTVQTTANTPTNIKKISSCQPTAASASSMLCIGTVSQTLVICISSLAPALPVARRPSAFQILMVRCFFPMILSSGARQREYLTPLDPFTTWQRLIVGSAQHHFACVHVREMSVYARVSEATWARSFPGLGPVALLVVEARVAVFSIKQDGGSTGASARGFLLLRAGRGAVSLVS